MVRFINDILLSAPSIVIGLFIYQVMVTRMGHFSGIAGAAALAVIVIPIVVRTTENMLLLVPGSLIEAASALGLPRVTVVARIAYKAARAGSHHRRAPCGRARQRRNGAAALHRAQQPVLFDRSQRADGEPAGDHLPVRHEPLQGLAGPRLDGRSSDYFTVLGLSILARTLSSRGSSR